MKIDLDRNTNELSKEYLRYKKYQIDELFIKPKKMIDIISKQIGYIDESLKIKLN